MSKTLPLDEWRAMVIRMVRGELDASPAFIEWVGCCVLTSYEAGDVDDDISDILDYHEQRLIATHEALVAEQSAFDERQAEQKLNGATPDYKCCDGCRESFSTDNLTVTSGDDCLMLCSVCLMEYELST